MNNSVKLSMQGGEAHTGRCKDKIVPQKCIFSNLGLFYQYQCDVHRSGITL